MPKRPLNDHWFLLSDHRSTLDFQMTGGESMYPYGHSERTNTFQHSFGNLSVFLRCHVYVLLFFHYETQGSIHGGDSQEVSHPHSGQTQSCFTSEWHICLRCFQPHFGLKVLLQSLSEGINASKGRPYIPELPGVEEDTEYLEPFQLSGPLVDRNCLG